MALVRICATSDIPDGEAYRFEGDGTPIAVFNLGGRYYAIGDTCTHQEESLSQGTIEDDTIVCQAHLARFSIPNGDVLEPPALEPVKTYPLNIQNEEIYLET